MAGVWKRIALVSLFMLLVARLSTAGEPFGVPLSLVYANTASDGWPALDRAASRAGITAVLHAETPPPSVRVGGFAASPPPAAALSPSLHLCHTKWLGHPYTLAEQLPSPLLWACPPPARPPGRFSAYSTLQRALSVPSRPIINLPHPCTLAAGRLVGEVDADEMRPGAENEFVTFKGAPLCMP